MQEAVEPPVKTVLVWATDTRSGIRYQEERQIRYDSEAENYKVLRSHRTGWKIMPGESDPVLTRKKRPNGTGRTPKKVVASGGESTTQAKRRRTGATDLIDWAAKKSGINSKVLTAFQGKGATGEKVMSAAYFLVATGETVNNIGSWQLQHDLPYAAGMSEDSCYQLFEDVGADETSIQLLFNGLADIAGKESAVLALDSTTESTYSKAENGLTPMARQGFNKAGDGLDAFKLMTFYSVDSRLPVSFEIQPGNIPDVSSVLNSIKRAKSYGLKKPQFVLDNGFYSKSNVLRFCRANVKFTIRATLADKWIYSRLDGDKKAGIASLRAGLDDVCSAMPSDVNTCGVSTSAMTEFSWVRERGAYGKAAGDVEKEEHRIYYHYFLNKYKRETQIQSLLTKLYSLKRRVENQAPLSEEEKKLSEKFLTIKTVRGKKIVADLIKDVVEEEVKDYGIFALISNIDKDAQSALSHYRLRNIIEESYRVIKTDLDGRRPRVWSTVKARGKEVCRLVALGLRFYLTDSFKKIKQKAIENSKNEERFSKAEREAFSSLARWLDAMTTKEILDWFDCIETVTVENSLGRTRWTTESIKRDQLFKTMLKEL